MEDVIRIAGEIMEGRRLKEGEDLSFLLKAPLGELQRGADQLREYFVGNRVDLCTILSGRSGRCPENCRFCAQSAHHHTLCQEYPLLPYEEILRAARENQEEGVSRFSIVNSGRGPGREEFERLLEIFEGLHHTLKIGLCASLGFLSQEEFLRLKQAGVEVVHNNLETSRRFFPKVCTTHTYQDKLENILRAQRAGLRVCSGGIIGLGEGWQDRIDMALELSRLGILSIPLNSLMPIPGTPLQNQGRLSQEEILRTVALFRYINPQAHIRLAGGRALMQDFGREAFLGGASASITGNMLTTCGSTIRQDRAMLKELGRDTTPLWRDATSLWQDRTAQ